MARCCVFTLAPVWHSQSQSQSQCEHAKRQGFYAAGLNLALPGGPWPCKNCPKTTLCNRQLQRLPHLARVSGRLDRKGSYPPGKPAGGMLARQAAVRGVGRQAGGRQRFGAWATEQTSRPLCPARCDWCVVDRCAEWPWLSGNPPPDDGQGTPALKLPPTPPNV